MGFGVPLQDLLNTRYFPQNYKVVAGEKGLSNIVTWVHVLEIRDIVRECVNGNELILTTGIGFATKQIAVNFLRELIEQKVAGLCIETALYYHEIDREMIELATEHDFPLIVIPEISRFIDICKGLNTMIISNDKRLFDNADYYDCQLKGFENRGSLEDGIRYTAEYLNVQVAYLPCKGKQIFSSQGVKKIFEEKIMEMREQLETGEVCCAKNFAAKCLKVFGKNRGYLSFYSPNRDLSQFETLILGRLAGKIENDIYHDLMQEEKKLYEDNLWLKEWLCGRLSQSAIREKMKEHGIFQIFEGFLVCAVKLPAKESFAHLQEEMQNDGVTHLVDFLLHTNIVVRGIFEEEGFSVCGYMEEGVIFYIIMVPRGAMEDLGSLERAVEKLRDCQNRFVDYRQAFFSVGKQVKRAEDLWESRKTALFGLRMSGESQNKVVVYDRLYINRILEHLKGQDVLEEFVFDHLGRLLEPENAELLHTLNVYFACGCSKQKTAEKLFIVRQTLYFRLQKIEEMLGSGFDEGEKRFAIEFALHAVPYTKFGRQSMAFQ